MGYRFCWVPLFCAAIVSCGPRPGAVPLKMIQVPPDEAKAALAIRVFELGSLPPSTSRIIGEVHATSCKNKTWQPPSSKGDALAQLRVKALRMGADAITDVTFDRHGTDAWGTNCWNSVTVSGIAVVLGKATAP